VGSLAVVVEDDEDLRRAAVGTEACGTMVENSAAWPASTMMVRSPSSSTMVPDRR